MWDDKAERSDVVYLLRPILVELVFPEDERRVEIDWEVDHLDHDYTKL